MKKKILLLLLLISTPVFAKQYTEYEFTGYEQERPLVDELTKYEEAYFHRYFKLKAGEKEIVDKYDPRKETYHHCSDTPVSKNEVISSEKSEHYENEGHILFRSANPGNASNLKIENYDTHLLTIEKVEILVSGNLAYTIENPDATNQVFMTNLPNVDIDDIETIIYYRATSYPKILFSLGETKVGSIINLDGEFNHITIKAYSPEKHEKFIREHNLNSQKILPYYSYIEEKYECYDDIREYYMDLPDEELEGYSYDPKEDIKVYKVYKRKILEVPVEEPDESQIPDKPLTTPEVLPNPPAASKPLDPVYPNTPIKPVVRPSEKEVKDEKPTYETDKDSDRIAFLDTDKKSNVLSKQDDGQTEEIKSTKEFWLIKLLLLVILILTIINTIHTLCVKKGD